MGMTLAEKTLARKCGKDQVVPGEIVVVPVDCAMMTDILGPRIIAGEMERIGRGLKDPDQGSGGMRPLYPFRHRESG